MGERATKQSLTAKNGTETLGSSPILKTICHLTGILGDKTVDEEITLSVFILKKKVRKFRH